MPTHVILLRGVMPTGKNRVPMAQLRQALVEAGLTDVRTYIQSGNAVVTSRLAPERLAATVRAAIARDIGADIQVITRTPAQIARVLTENPFADADPAQLYFTFLAAPATAEALRQFQAADFAPDAVRIVGDTVYARYATRLSDSRYNNNFFERRLAVAATTRNFNTLSRLVEMARHPAG